ncbi:polyprenyl synthetase family protein [Ornithinimicrobium flavum]|uniref:polyprenyl synthetase family protein n=1 Tax=Ornithinimicrobium flavum TaxID=1288636 RepID=UPI00106FBBC8|nr:polyprenyl synthetase family protein [Ornithinimicrobium flavum]
MTTVTETQGPTVGSGTAAPHERFFSAGAAQVLDDHDRALWAALQQATAHGKRFRPALLTGVHAALGGEDHARAERVGDAVELLHTAFVIHDDVIDGDQVRRGRPNVSGTFAARAVADGADPARAGRYGEAAGILAGDLALAGAVREIATCGARPDVTVALLDLLEEVLHRSAAGELADVRLSLTGAAPMAEVLDVAEWKTAAYSFELPLRAGALLAGASDSTVATLGAVGRCMGVGFQLQDDLDGVFAPSARTGKDPLGDLREGKCTALVAVARTTAWWPELSRYVGDPHLTPEGAARAREILLACGALHVVSDLVRDLREAALAGVADLPAPVQDFLRPMVTLLLRPEEDRWTAAESLGRPVTGVQGAA